MRSAKSRSKRSRAILASALGIEQLEDRLLFATNVTASGRPLGVDVSMYQKTINWTTLAGQKDFAIIKGTGSDDGNYLDPYFSSNASGARSSGIIFGTYHFAYPASSTSATAQADYMIANSGVAMENGNLPPMLDLEKGTTDPTTISNWVNAFCYEIYAKLGVKPIIYTSSGTYAEDVNSSVTSMWKFVDANYGSSDGVYTDSSSAVNSGGPATGNWPTWTIWQYNSVDSFSSIQTNPVDADVFNGTLSQLQSMEIGAQAVVLKGGTFIASGGGTDNSGNAIVENYGTVNLNATSPTMTFTIKNEGTPNVTLGNLQVPSGYTIVSGLTSTTLTSLQQETITVKLNTTTGGTFGGNITFTTNDSSTPTFKIPVTGTVVAPAQVVVKEASTVITNGQTTKVSFGSAKQGAASPGIIFTVSNPGGSTLTTSGLTVPSGYTVTNSLSSSIAAGGSDTFTVTLSTANVGTFSGNVSFTNNVSGQSPFTFPITGTITDATPPTIVSGTFDSDYQPTTVSFQFSEPVQTLSTSSLAVSNTDGGTAATVTGYSYNSTTNTATFILSSGLASDHYQAVVSGVKDIAGNALSGANALDFSFLTGDTNGDGTVNSSDFAVLAADYGQTGNLKFSQGDFNYDGTVNALDFNALASHFGDTMLPAGSSLATGAAPADSEMADSVAAAPPGSATPTASLFSSRAIASAIDLTDGSEGSVL